MTHALKAIDHSDNYAVLFFILLTSRKAKMDTVYIRKRKDWFRLDSFLDWQGFYIFPQEEVLTVTRMRDIFICLLHSAQI